MALLKDTTVSGNLRVTDSAITDSVQTKIINAPTASNGTTYGPGSNGQVLKSNGTSVYWASDANSVTGVKGNAESSYRTGQVNLTPANVGAVAVAQGSGNAGRFLMVNSSGNVEATAVTTKAATTYNTSTSDQTIASGTYLTGAQTIKAVTTANIDAGNIKKGVVVTVGDANSATRIKNVTGTFTTTPSGKTALTAAALRSGYAGFINGSVVDGSMPNAVITSGTASITSVSVTDGSSGSTFILSGAANVSAPTVETAGYISSSDGTKNSKTSGAQLSASINKIVGTASITTTKKAPSITKQDVPSGVTQAASGSATTTAPTSGVYVAVKSAENVSTVTPTISITTSGYGTNSKHGITASGASVGAAASSMTYIPITTATPAFSSPTPSGGSTATGTNVTLSTTNNGMLVQTKYSVNQATVTYSEAVEGWVSKASGAEAVKTTARSSTNGTAYYVTAVTMPKDKGFTVTTTADTALDTTSDLDVTNNAYRRVDITNNANGTVLVGGAGTTQFTSGSATTGSLTVNGYNNASTPALTGAKNVVTNGKWVINDVSTSGTYYGMTVVPSTMIIPSGNIQLTQSTSTDVTAYATATVRGVTAAISGGALSGTATVSGSSCSISDSTNNSGVSITTACTATRAKVSCTASTAGWASGTIKELAQGTGAMTAKTYYVNGVTLTKPSSGTRTFSVTVPNGSSTATFTFNVDTSGNVTITES